MKVLGRGRGTETPGVPVRDNNPPNELRSDPESQYYIDLFIKNPEWSTPYPNQDESARWEKIEGFLKEVASRQPPGQPLRMLEVGCGRGWLTQLASNFGECEGVEPVAAVVKQAQKLFPDRFFRAGTADTVLESADFKAYDLVLASEVIEHVAQAKKPAFIRKLFGLLKPGGHVILTTPRGEALKEWSLLMGNPSQPLEDWMREPDLRQLFVEQQFSVCGLVRVLFETTSRRFVGKEHNTGAGHCLPIYQVWLFQKSSNTTTQVAPTAPGIVASEISRHASLRARADSLVQQSKWVEGAQLCGKLLDDSPRDIDLLLLTAKCVFNAGDSKTTETLSRYILEVEPSNREALEYLRLCGASQHPASPQQEPAFAVGSLAEAPVKKSPAVGQANRAPQVIAIISAHNEGDVIFHVIGDLISNDINVYLIDHCSTDNTVEEAGKWLGKGLLKLERFPGDCGYPERSNQQYVWRDLLRRKEELALELGAAWYIHADADEFRESPWPGLTLAEAIRRVDLLGYTAINFELLNFRPTDDCFGPGTDVRAHLTHYERTEVFNAVQIKAWKNTGQRVSLADSGGHSVEFPGRKVFPIAFVLRHYPIRGETHGRKKVFRERLPRFAPEERADGWHLQYNDLTESGTSFLRDPSNLFRYDANEVRARLLGRTTEDLMLMLALGRREPVPETFDQKAICTWAARKSGWPGPLAFAEWQKAESLLPALIQSLDQGTEETWTQLDARTATLMSVFAGFKLAVARLQNEGQLAEKLSLLEGKLTLKAIALSQTGVPSKQTEVIHPDSTRLGSLHRVDLSSGSLSIPVRASIILLCYNKVELTKKCIIALKKNTPQNLYELIVVDNASTDGTAAFLAGLQRETPNLRVLTNKENLGFVEGNNAGARMATTEHLVFLNNDTEPQPGWLEALLQTLDTDSRAGAVGAKLIYPNGTLQEAGGIIFSDGSGWNYGRGKDPRDPRFNFLREVDYCSGACLLVKRHLFEAAGGFDTRFAPAYYEDTDLCFWIRSAGWRVLYQPASVVVHHEGATAGTNLQSGFKRFQTINHAKFREKWEQTLKQQCAPGEGNVAQASDRRSGKRLLVVDALMPMYDRASGSRRMREILRLLAAAGHKVTFLARNGANGARYTAALQSFGVEVYAGDPDRMRQLGYQSDAWRLDLSALLLERKFEKAFLSFWYIAEHYLPFLRIVSPATAVYVDTVDVHYVRELRRAELEQDHQALAGIAERKLRELRTYWLADQLIAVTQNDADALRTELPASVIKVVPNIHAIAADVPAFSERNGILFVGNFAHPPNEDAVLFFHQQIWPPLKAKLPDLELTIVGNNPPPKVKALAGNGITVTGYVPEMEPYVRSHRVSIAPLRYGAGMKGKIGEALAAGLPVVTTSVGAEGMSSPGEAPFVVRDDPAAFADSVAELYLNQATWAKFSSRGRAHMDRNFSPAVVGRQLEEVVTQPAPPSIIILTVDRLADTQLCLKSIEQHTTQPYELILVDNGSTDGTVSFFRQYASSRPHVRVVLNQSNRGFAGGNNQALSIARGEHIVLLNNDTVVTPGWLEGMQRVLDQDPAVGIVGPMSNYVAGPQQVPTPGYQSLDDLDDFAVRWRQEHAGQSAQLNRVIGFCLTMRRQVLERIGALDERFVNGNFEDDDYCLRAVAAGFKIHMAKEIFIHHTGSRTFQTLGLDYRKNMLANWERFKAKWGIPASTPIEQGYRLPVAVPNGHSVFIPLSPLTSTCKSDAFGIVWADKRAGAKTDATPQPLPECAKLAKLTDVREKFERKQLPEAWAGTVAALELRPHHPEAWLVLAKIALAAGNAEMARQCARKARELAPDWNAPAQFLKKPLNGKSRPEWLRPPKDQQEPAREAQARLSVCVITRNEELNLSRCLASVQTLADQIVVVDTGSTDKTLDIARNFGAEVHDFKWSDDFSAARNAALEHARGDWILILDADEELPSDQHARLKVDMSNRKLIALRLPLVNQGQEAEGRSYVPRLFRNAPGVHFAGRIHEQVFPSLITLGKVWGLATGLGTAQILHHGYTKEAVAERKKVERNLNLLRKAVEECPEDANLTMNLGLELVRSGEVHAGLVQYRRAFELMADKPADEVGPELCEALLTQFTAQLYKGRAYEEVVGLLTSPLAKRNRLTASLSFALGLASFALGRYAEAAEQMRQCLSKRAQPALTPINTDILTAAPHHCLAMSLAKNGDSPGAERAFETGLKEKGRDEELRLDYARFLIEQNRSVEALNLLHQFVTEWPQSIPAWQLGGQIALSRPDFLEFACDWTAEAVRHLPESVELLSQRAEALLLNLQIEEARELWQTVWHRQSQPRAAAALVLCELMEDQPRAGLHVYEPEVGEISRAFINLYQHCLAMRAQSLVSPVNERLEKLCSRLPAAANMIEAALTEAANIEPVSAPEPCLA
jgi:GT2 family glycosyltransferase/glycosyltransferase involved in cell wall biosynthesis/SAM-dependent methyltransferase/Tfp pilus assembly protein PilF